MSGQFRTIFAILLIIWWVEGGKGQQKEYQLWDAGSASCAHVKIRY